MVAVPVELKDAQAYINQYHRHHQAAHRDKFRIAAMQDDEIVGVVQVGRPVSRVLDDGKTLEVLRLCTNGTKNVCSFLYSRAAKIAKEMGYSRTSGLACSEGLDGRADALLDALIMRCEEIFLPYIETQNGQTSCERMEEKQFLETVI